MTNPKQETVRAVVAAQLEETIRPLLAKSRYDGGYDCCGCSTYDAILDHAIAIVKGEPYPVEEDEWDDRRPGPSMPLAGPPSGSWPPR